MHSLTLVFVGWCWWSDIRESADLHHLSKQPFVAIDRHKASHFGRGINVYAVLIGRSIVSLPALAGMSTSVNSTNPHMVVSEVKRRSHKLGYLQLSEYLPRELHATVWCSSRYGISMTVPLDETDRTSGWIIKWSKHTAHVIDSRSRRDLATQEDNKRGCSLGEEVKGLLVTARSRQNERHG